jgi:hypothetical protein
VHGAQLCDQGAAVPVTGDSAAEKQAAADDTEKRAPRSRSTRDPGALRA